MNLIKASNQKWWVLGGVSIASFLGCVDFTIVNTALPAIQANFGSSITQLQWIINIFILALSTCMVTAGRAADIYGRRCLLYIGMIVFGLASLCAGLVNKIEWLICFRLIQGMSCAILYTSSAAIVAEAFPKHERGKAIGALYGINGIGLAIGPMLGGFIVSALNWRWVFFINVPFILISLAICFFSIRTSQVQNKEDKLDWYGLITLTIALSLLILGIIQGDQWGWVSAYTITCFTISSIMLACFYYIETKVKYPIIQFYLFVNRIFLISAVATFALAFFYCAAFFLMPLYLHIIRAETGYQIGIMLLPTTAMVAILSPVVGKVVDRVGPQFLLIIGLSFFISSAWLQANFTENSSVIFILFSFVLMGIGWACILGPSTVAALSSVPEEMSAVAMGSSWTLHNIGGAIGLALAAATYRSYQHINGNDIFMLRQAFLSGYQATMKLLIMSSLISLVIVAIGTNKKFNFCRAA